MGLKVFVVMLAIIHGFQAFELGKSFSVLRGLKPVLPNATSFNQIFHPVKKSNLFQKVQTKTNQSTYPEFGPFIQLTYHADEKDLIKSFFSVWKFTDERSSSGPFTRQPNINGETNMATEYSKLLGISFDNVMGKVYVLARYWKKINTTIMATDNVTTRALAHIALNCSGDAIIKKFSEYGTHYVSGYDMGDLIYQVFVYDKKDADRVLRFGFENPQYAFGRMGHYFRMYTELKTERGTGFCREAGKVLTASKDSAWPGIVSQLNDDIFRVPQSIFMFLVKYEGYLLPRTLTTVIPIRLFFKPIIAKLLPGDSKSQTIWNNVLPATVFQKFGPTVHPNFPHVFNPAVEEFYDSSNPSLVTSTATNYVTITRMSFALSDFFVSNPTFVTHVFIFADVLKLPAATKIKLPGSEKIYLICRELIALSSGNKVPEIIVGSFDNSAPTVKIVAKTMRGVFKVTQAETGEHFTYANDEVYETSKDPVLSGQYTVSTDNSKRFRSPDRVTLPELYIPGKMKSHEIQWLQASLVNSVQLSVTSLEIILAIHINTDSVNAARKCLEWTTNFLTNARSESPPLSIDLEMALGRALLISKTHLTAYAQGRRLVPKLTFSQYKPLYDQLLTQVSRFENTFQTISREIIHRKYTETTTETVNELNDNLKSIGSFLVQKAEIGAQYQDEVASTNQRLHDLESDRMTREQDTATILWKEIVNTQKETTAAGNALRKAIEACKTEQIISAVFSVISVVGSLFTGGVGVLKVDQEIHGIVRVARKVENAISITEQVNKLYSLGRELRKDVGNINRAMENLPSLEVGVISFPTELDWDDFDTDVVSYTSAAVVPSQVAREALDYQRAAKRLSSRGRKYLSIASNIASMKYRQINLEMQRDLAYRQSDRLRVLKTRLVLSDLTDNAANMTDLFEIGTVIKMKENQVRSHLIQSFGLMDAALQYQYFQKPAVIKRYDTLSILKAVANQVQSTITALKNFPSVPEDLKQPIEYNIPGVRVEELLSPDGCELEIPLSSFEFQDFVRVRIRRVEVRADNIEQVSKNEAYIEAIASGESFQDRDLDRNPISFTTTPTSYRFTYNITTGKALVKSNPSSDFHSRFIKMTPFDKWVFRFPNVTTNEGLRFSSSITRLRIKFFVNAIFHPPRRTSSSKVRRSNVLGSKDQLLSQMNGRSLVRSWDAIMAVSAERVNKIWRQQYENQTNAGFVKRIITKRTVDSDYVVIITYARCFLEVGPPRIQFIQHNPNEVTLTVPIKSGTVEFSTYTRKDGQIAENPIYVNNQTIHGIVEIVAYVELIKIKGLLTNDSKVVLDMSNAIVSLPKLVGGASTAINVQSQIRSFFSTRLRSSDFEVARITYEKILTPPSLVPDRFYLATGGFGPGGSGYGTLYVFFRTHLSSSTATEGISRDFNDPITIDRQIIPNGYEVALFISNKIIYGDIMLQDVQKQVSFGVHTANFPGTASPSQQPKYIVGDSSSKMKIHLSTTAGRAKAVISASGFKVRSVNKGRMIHMSWVAQDQPITIPYEVERCSGYTYVRCRKERKTTTRDFDVSMVRYFRPVVAKNLAISYIGQPTTVDVDSESISGWDIFWNHGLQQQDAKDKIETSLRNYLQNLKFDFRKISAFAITQVLFPNRNVFKFTEVYIPGDMLILGHVSTNTREKK